MAKKKHKAVTAESTSSRFSYFTIGVLIFAVVSIPFLALLRNLFNTSTVKPSLNEFACKDYFDNQTFNTYGKSIKTILIGELHGADEQHVVDCLATLVNTGDRLLIEAPGNGKEVPCDDITPVYGEFNGKLKCYGFDVPVDDARRLYGDSSVRYDMLSQYAPRIFNGVASAQEGIKRLISFADMLIESSDQAPQFLMQSDPDAVRRSGKYLKQLAKKMSGLTLLQIQELVGKELGSLAEKKAYYYKLSRGGPTNDALVDQIKFHQQQLQGSNNQLFAVAGAAHFSLKKNKQLQKVVDGAEPVTILMSKAAKAHHAQYKKGPSR